MSRNVNALWQVGKNRRRLTEMLAAAMERGRDRGLAAVEGQALPGDRHTKNLYERAGIVARLITTYRAL